MTSVADVRLVARAMKNDWPTTPEIKSKVIESMVNLLSLGDPKVTIAVHEALVKADLANLKRAELEAKEKERDEQKRIRLLEFLKSCGPDEIGKLAQSSGVSVGVTEVGRAEVRP